MIQKLISALILAPLAILFVVFAVANRQTVVVSFDPFDAAQPMLSVGMPLFALILLLAVGGVVVGGVAANSELRAALPGARFAPLPLCTDNAAMIASAARYVEPLPYPSYLGLDAYASAA